MTQGRNISNEVRNDGATHTNRKLTVLLWIIQALLAALFLFAGYMKLVLPLEALKGPVEFPGLFLRFIGVAEVLGALGLVLPGLLRIRTELTPLAAAGLVIIMIGATATVMSAGDVVPALFPLTVGVLAAFVAYGRWRTAPLGKRSGGLAPRRGVA
jgi:uncharacterized membrane protein YphA (DoxX/SURF4 family)